MTSHRKGTDPAADRARAEALFRRREAERRVDQAAVEEYRANQQAELDKAARLKAMRLARGG
jgi:hypothetical protein